MKTLIAAAILCLSALAHAAPELGKPAPDFTLNNQDGKPVKLSDARGKYVVLEWYNKDCPFVRKHYGSGNMQGLQKKYGAKGVVWYSIVSSHKGGEGYLTPAKAQKQMKSMSSNAILLDESGDVGHLYGAKTTPHMFIIDPKGTLIYMGGIDNVPSTDAADIKGAMNFVSLALDEAMANKPVTTPSSTPYGCSVKY